MDGLEVKGVQLWQGFPCRKEEHKALALPLQGEDLYRVSYVKGEAVSRGFTPSRKVGDQPSVTCVVSFGILRDRRGNGGNANIPCFVVFSGFSTTATKTSVWSPILALGFLKGLLLLASASGRGVIMCFYAL